MTNPREAQLAVALYLHLADENPDQLREPGAVGIVSPYKAQVKLIRTLLNEALGEERAKKLVDVNTIDGFQGREKDLVIFSAVRAREHKKIGFVADERRINVGLTRARASMLVIGHAGALSQDEHWANLIHHCKQRGYLYRLPPGSKALNTGAGIIHFKGQIRKMVAGDIISVAPEEDEEEYTAIDTQEELEAEAEPEQQPEADEDKPEVKKKRGAGQGGDLKKKTKK